MKEVYYKIGEVAELLNIEQHTLRYLENALKLKIKRDERGDRLYSESDLETLRLISTLKKEKGLNTTAIKLALENMEDSEETALSKRAENTFELPELISAAKKINDQYEEIIIQNKRLQQKIEELETKMVQRDIKREERIDELIRLWQNEQEERNKSWFSRLKRK